MKQSHEDHLHEMAEEERRKEFMEMQHQFTEGNNRTLKYGYFKGQVGGWAAEFEKVTNVTGVRFGEEGKSDAVSKVVQLFSSNELRNSTLFKFVTEDNELQKEMLQAEVDALEAEEAKLQFEINAQMDADTAQQYKGMLGGDLEEHLEHQLAAANKQVDAILPKVEVIGTTLMEMAGVNLPQHMEGKPLDGMTVPPFLALLEDALGEVQGRMKAIVVARAPPVPRDEEEAEAMAKLPPEVVSPTLAVLREAAAKKQLASGKNAEKMLHHDSSELLHEL